MTTMIDTRECTEVTPCPVPDPFGPVTGVARTPCQDVDPEWFFAEVPEVIEDAKRVCQPCAMRTACLDGALRRREPHGVWGGELFQDGVIIERKRPRGRPPKTIRPSLGADEPLSLAA